jgi:hypothetical protein
VFVQKRQHRAFRRHLLSSRFDHGPLRLACEEQGFVGPTPKNDASVIAGVSLDKFLHRSVPLMSWKCLDSQYLVDRHVERPIAAV